MMNDFTKEDQDEIIAIQFGSTVCFGESAIRRCIESKTYTKLIPRAVFKVMAEMDLGHQWAEYANYPTIFKLSDVK